MGDTVDVGFIIRVEDGWSDFYCFRGFIGIYFGL